MKTLFVSKNGEQTNDGEIKHYLDQAFQHDDGVYEAFRVYNHCPFRLNEHLKRLEYSAGLKQVRLPQSPAVIRQWCLEAVNQSDLANQFVFAAVKSNEVVIISREMENVSDRQRAGVKVITYRLDRPSPGAKSLEARRLSALAMKQAKEKAGQEVILVNHAGCCTEGAYSNLFWIEEGQIFTNKTEALSGITQQAIIEVASAQYPVQFAMLTRDQLFDQDELFLTSARIGIMPVVNVDSNNIGNGQPGSITRELQCLFNELTEKECAN